jgi:hypothetical protein
MVYYIFDENKVSNKRKNYMIQTYLPSYMP